MCIHVEINDWADGRVATVTVANPAKLNILGHAGMTALTGAIARLGEDPDLRCVILRGEGARAFIGGADITEMATLDTASGEAFITALHGACAAIRACPVPVIARMQGYTLGAGLEIAASCDMRIAADTAKMGMPEVRIGIPSVIEAALLPMLIGWGRTRRLLLTGETIDAATALAWGLVEEVAPEATLDAALARLVAMILAGAPLAMRRQKALILAWEDLTPTAAIQAGIDSFAESWSSPEPAARMAAFLAARKAAKPG